MKAPSPSITLSRQHNRRTIYIAADSVPWSYAPKGDACTDPGLAALQLPVHTLADPTGGTFMKALYREYVDGTFKVSIGVLLLRPAKNHAVTLLAVVVLRNLACATASLAHTTARQCTILQALKPRPARQEHLGILGPLIYVEAGSSINIVLKNNLPEAVNMEPSGGHTWTDQPPGFLTLVQPGETATYKWIVSCLHSCIWLPMEPRGYVHICLLQT